MALIDNYTDEEFITIINNSNNLHEAAIQMGYSDTSRSGDAKVSKRCKAMGIPLPGLGHGKKISTVYKVSDEEFKSIVENAISLADVCRKVGLNADGTNARMWIKKRCTEMGIPVPTYNAKAVNVKPGNKIPLDQILVENSTYISTSNLKLRIIKEGVLPYRCALCGNNGEWMGRKLSLQLHHINGTRTDNRIENLQLLCPNCHSQTENYSGRNRSDTKTTTN